MRSNAILKLITMGLIGYLTQAYAVIPETDNDKTLSPYFLVQGDSQEIETLPLKNTRADVTIAGVIANVKLTQLYQNTGKTILEAIYVFPASTRSAVHAMKMTIGERVIEATIQEKEQARQNYQQALSQGKTASLLEQQRPNVFQMNVGNILPGDLIKVEMQYTELVIPEEGVYEFVYPTVVGPRYSNKTADEKSDQWIQNPYLHQGQDSPFTFGLDLTLNSGQPISQISSPSHEIKPIFTGTQSAHIVIPEDNKSGNRDFILKYVLSSNTIESGLLLYPGKDENFFLLMVEPPKTVKTQEISNREYLFIVDVSGSMYGFPLEISKKFVNQVLNKLHPSDYFNVVLFAGGSSILSTTSLPATPQNIHKAVDLINRQTGGGATELLPAIQKAFSLPRVEHASRSVVVVTDGYVGIEKETFEYIRQNLGKGNLFAFGIGTAVNRFLIEGMARAGIGEPFVVSDPNKAEHMADKLVDYITSPVLTGIKVTFDNFSVAAVEPPHVPDLFARRPILVFGKYQGNVQGTIKITGQTAAGPFNQIIEATQGISSSDHTALRYLWARQRIAQLADDIKLDKTDNRIKEVTALGLKYNLMTDYTSFVAIDSEIRTKDGKRTVVKQPLPLPQGVSDFAVGETSPGPGGGVVLGSVSVPTRSFTRGGESINTNASGSGSIASAKIGGISANVQIQPSASVPREITEIVTGDVIDIRRGGYRSLDEALKTPAPLSEKKTAQPTMQVENEAQTSTQSVKDKATLSKKITKIKQELEFLEQLSNPSLKVEVLSIEGPIFSSDLTSLIEKNLKAFEQCFSSTLSTHPNPSKVFTILFTFNPNGTLTDVTLEENNDKTLVTCVTSVLQTLPFPKDLKISVKARYRVTLSDDFYLNLKGSKSGGQ